MSHPSPDQPPVSEGSYIFDSESASEMARLTHQGQLLTKAMHGPLEGIDQNEIAQWKQVIDLGCGPGDWVLDVAFDHPAIEVAGIDISRIMVDYANVRAQSQQRINASFEVMDICSPLEFPDGSFDMVNARLLFGVLRGNQWVPFIEECMRILRPGGLLRLTEPVDICVTSSPAHEKLVEWFLQLLWKNGYGFSVDGKSVGLTYKLPRLLREAGCQGVEQIGHCLDFSGDTGNWTAMYRNFEISLGASLSLFEKVGITTLEEAKEQYQRMLIELHSDDFCGTWHFASFQGRKS